MSAILFNREDFKHPADRWYHIEPKGVHRNHEVGVDQVIDDTACSAIVNRFNADADAGVLPQGHEMLIDHEHFKALQDQETVAYGWLHRLQSRADGIYGKIRWTAVGQAAVDGGDYRFFSSEYVPEDLVALGGSPPRIRPMRLDGLTLTNVPNNRGGKPITNRAGAGQNRLPEASNPRAAQDRAAKWIAWLADEEQRLSGCSLSQSWLHVMNREQRLAASASGKAMPGQLPAREREAQADPAEFASRMLHQLARARPFPSFFQNLAFIRNRFPGLARMENRKAGWDALADLEPAAQAEYLKANRNPNVFSTQMYAATAALRSQIQNLRPEEQTRKIEELYPQLLSQYRLEEAASEPHFEAVMQSVVIEFPDLGFEDRWEKMKEKYPKLFWQFVLSVGSQSEKEP